MLTLAPLEARAERLPIKTYTTAEGLAHNDVNRIVKDSQGFLWFCTAGGLSRYDGYAFTNFTIEQGLPDPVVNDLLETRNGEYWVATNGGLVHFDPKGSPARDGSNQTRPGPRRPMFSVVVSHNDKRRAQSIRVLLQGRDGAIWAGTGDGLARLRQSDGHHVLEAVEIGLPAAHEQRIVADVLEDDRGALWIAVPSGLYRRGSDRAHSKFPLQDGLPTDLPSDLLQDADGQLWVSTHMRGTSRISQMKEQGGSATALTIRMADGLPADWIYQLFQTADRRFWAATSRGLSEILIDGEGRVERVRSYDERQGLSSFEITAINEDLAGNLWLGTNTAGAMKLTRRGITSFDERDGLKSIHAVFEDRAGNLCFRGVAAANTERLVIDPAFGCFDGGRVDWFKPA